MRLKLKLTAHFIKFLLLFLPQMEGATTFIKFRNTEESGLNFCDPKTQNPCNAPFYKENCDVSLCLTQTSVFRPKQNASAGVYHICSCMNYRLNTEMKFRENVMMNVRCIRYNYESVHDFPLCQKVCKELEKVHKVEGVVNPLYGMAQHQVYGCYTDLSDPTGYSEEDPIAADYLQCFCYTSLPILIQIPIKSQVVEDEEKNN